MSLEIKLISRLWRSMLGTNGGKYHDTSVNFLDIKVQFGRDLGPAMYIGPAMARPVHGWITYKTGVISLTPEELTFSDEVQLRLEYDKAIRDKLGGQCPLMITRTILTLPTLTY
jgi:hypothetical protein